MKKIKIAIVIDKRFFQALIVTIMIMGAGAGFFLIEKIASAGTLNCFLATSCSGTTVLRMYNTTNSHAGTPTGSTYPNLVCCTGVTGLGTNCSGTYQLLGTLSGANNAHFQDSLKTNYLSANDICLSVTSGTVSAGTSTDCTVAGYDTTVFSFSGTSGTNAHVATSTGTGSYTTKICATATGPSLTLIVTTDDFPALTPGTSRFATSTISVDTNNSTGWYVTLSRDDADTTMDLNTDATVNITDQTVWLPGAATTTAGNAVIRTSLDNSGDVLAFRVMTASGTPSFISTSWWGANDVDGTAKWAGINSTAQKIGDSSVSSGGSPALNTVQYYLDVPTTQKTGAYSGTITYTAVMN